MEEIAYAKGMEKCLEEKEKKQNTSPPIPFFSLL